MKLQGVKDAEAWQASIKFPVDQWVKATIVDAEETESSKGNPQIKVELEAANGATVRDWIAATPAAMGGVKAFLLAAGVDLDALDVDEFDPATLVGNKVGVYCTDEPSYKDPSKVYATPQGYKPPQDVKAEPGHAGPVDTSDFGPKADDDDIPF